MRVSKLETIVLKIRTTYLTDKKIEKWTSAYILNEIKGEFDYENYVEHITDMFFSKEFYKVIKFFDYPVIDCGKLKDEIKNIIRQYAIDNDLLEEESEDIFAAYTSATKKDVYKLQSTQQPNEFNRYKELLHGYVDGIDY